MLEILRDQIWQFIGAFVGVVAIALTIVLYLRQRSIKQISCQIISDTSLVSIQDEIKSRIKVLFDDEIVRDVRLTIIKVFNSGNAAIKPDDYISPIRFDFGENAKVLEIDTLEEVPEDLNAIPSGDEVELNGQVVLNTVLLNRGDSVTFKALVSQMDKIRISGRVIDVKDFKMVSDEVSRLNWLIEKVLPGWLGVSLGAVLTWWLIVLVADDSPLNFVPLWLISIFLLIALIITFVFAAVSEFSKKT